VRVGVFTALLANLSLDQVIAKLKGLDIDTVELGTGNYPGDPHCKLSMLENAAALDEFKAQIAAGGVSISALSCHGEPLHPNAEIAQKSRETSRRTILLAEKLGVPVVIDFSGCPGDSDGAKFPNWVTCAWPTHFGDILEWQWREKAIPYWKERTKFAADHGVKIALEMHPGFLVYNPEAMLRLRAEAGANLGCNFDPSHLFWQGIDPIKAVRILGDAIFHVHAKDTQIYDANLPLTGVLDTKKYTDERHRSWIFRSVGYGHDAGWWSEFISTLSMYGYDYVLSIEHEDSLMSTEEGLAKAARFLQSLVIREKPGVAYWA
jgi:sugar phosphate isomerase/epimerase